MEPGVEISDVVVDYDPVTLVRRPVRRADAIALLGRGARRVVRAFPERGGYLDPDAVDAQLVSAHLELQRLHEEFHTATRLLEVLTPMVAAIRRAEPQHRIRLVDLGCGIGYVIRWLAARAHLDAGVELIGTDFNEALVCAAQRLAAQERLSCRFVRGDALRLAEPASILISTGVIHHFRGDALVDCFRAQVRTGALAMVHLDIRPTWAAPVGAFIFHQARMRVPLARHDGYHSAVRAHPRATLVAAMRAGAPELRHAMLDARIPWLPLMTIMHATISMRPALEQPFLDAAPPDLRRQIERCA